MRMRRWGSSMTRTIPSVTPPVGVSGTTFAPPTSLTGAAVSTHTNRHPCRAGSALATAASPQPAVDAASVVDDILPPGDEYALDVVVGPLRMSAVVTCTSGHNRPKGARRAAKALRPGTPRDSTSMESVSYSYSRMDERPVAWSKATIAVQSSHTWGRGRREGGVFEAGNESEASNMYEQHA